MCFDTDNFAAFSKLKMCATFFFCVLLASYEPTLSRSWSAIHLLTHDVLWRRFAAPQINLPST